MVNAGGNESHIVAAAAAAFAAPGGGGKRPVTSADRAPDEIAVAPIVICVRHPDFANELEVFGGDVEIIDVDYGRSNLADPDEYEEWREAHMEALSALRERAAQLSSPALAAAADAYESAINAGKGVR